jgi:sporulation protein YlmC with PRC-barrel domain
MTDGVQFAIGTEVVCTDGPAGVLQRVVIDPVKNALTHLVVEPKQHGHPGHLVPVDLVEGSSGDEIRLRCALADLGGLETAEETKFLSGATGEWGYADGEMLSQPYVGLAGMGMAGLGMSAMAPGTGSPEATVFDKVPLNEVEVRRGEHVFATDGPIGRVQGLVVDPGDHHVTHFLLEEGHLWGQKEVAIPIAAVSSVEDGVQLSMSKDDVRDLPPVDLDRPG